MIHRVFEYLTEELNSYFKGKFNYTEDIVYASALVALDGSVDIPSENKLVTTLVNVEQDTTRGSPGLKNQVGNDSFNKEYFPAISLNLYMLVSAYYNKKNYLEALKFLSETIAFFQRKPVFDRSNSPGLDAQIDKLTLEIVNINTHDLSNLWGMLGSHYLPSILYKIRTITIDGSALRSLQHKIVSTEKTTQAE